MTIIELLLGALAAIKDMGAEDAKEAAILRDCMAKSLHMGTGDKARWN